KSPLVLIQIQHSSANRSALSQALDAAIVNYKEIFLQNGIERITTNPDRAVTILKERKHKFLANLGVQCHPPVLQTCQTFIGANPKAPIAAGEQVDNHARRQVLIGWRFPSDDPDAVEAKQPELRTQPEIAIARLSNGVNPSFGKTFAVLPRGVSVLTDVQRRIQRDCGRRRRKQHPAKEHPAQNARPEKKSSSSLYARHAAHILMSLLDSLLLAVVAGRTTKPGTLSVGTRRLIGRAPG